jgi:ketosteroid isomerase-like protein
MQKLKILMLAVAMPLLAQAGDQKGVEAEIRALEEAFNTAYATNEVDTYFSYYTPDATLFFYGERQPVERYYDTWQTMVAAGGTVERNDVSDLQIQVLAGGKAAVATSFIDNQTRSPDGEVTAARAFETNVWQKTEAGWKIVSLHYSEFTE